MKKGLDWKRLHDAPNFDEAGRFVFEVAHYAYEADLGHYTQWTEAEIFWDALATKNTFYRKVKRGQEIGWYIAVVERIP